MGNGALAVTEQYCEYTHMKIDKDIVDRIHAAARLEGKSTQEWLSDVANMESARVVKRDPVKRKSPPPHPKKKPKRKK